MWRILGLLSILGLFLGGCGRQNVTAIRPTPTFPAGWQTLSGKGVRIALPERYSQVDFDNLDAEIEKIQRINPALVPAFQALKETPGELAFWATDYHTGDTVYIYGVEPELHQGDPYQAIVKMLQGRDPNDRSAFGDAVSTKHDASTTGARYSYEIGSYRARPSAEEPDLHSQIFSTISVEQTPPLDLPAVFECPTADGRAQPAQADLATRQVFPSIFGPARGAVTPDGAAAFVAARDQVLVYDLATLTVQRSIATGPGMVAWNPDLSMLVSLHQGRLTLWDGASGARQIEFPVHSYADHNEWKHSSVQAILLSPDARVVVIQTHQDLNAWDTATGTLLYTLPDQAVIMTRDSGHLLTLQTDADFNQALVVRNLLSAEIDQAQPLPLEDPKNPGQGPIDLTFAATTASGHCLILAFRTEVWGWDLETGALITKRIPSYAARRGYSATGRLKLDQYLAGKRGPVGSVSYVDEHVRLVGTVNAAVYLNVKIASPPGDAFFTPDEQHCLFTDADGNLTRFAVEASDLQQSTFKPPAAQTERSYLLPLLASLGGAGGLALIWRRQRRRRSNDRDTPMQV